MRPLAGEGLETYGLSGDQEAAVETYGLSGDREAAGGSAEIAVEAGPTSSGQAPEIGDLSPSRDMDDILAQFGLTSEPKRPVADPVPERPLTPDSLSAAGEEKVDETPQRQDEDSLSFLSPLVATGNDLEPTSQPDSPAKAGRLTEIEPLDPANTHAASSLGSAVEPVHAEQGDEISHVETQAGPAAEAGAQQAVAGADDVAVGLQLTLDVDYDRVMSEWQVCVV